MLSHEELMVERNKRVSAAIAHSKYSFNDLEKITGIPHSTLQRYVSGTTDKIPVTFYEAIAHATNKNVEYLLCFDDFDEIEEAAPDIIKDGNPKTIELWRELLRAMTDDNRQKLQDYAELLLLKQDQDGQEE